MDHEIPHRTQIDKGPSDHETFGPVYCRENHFITGMRARVQDWCNACDNTAYNNIDFICTDKDTLIDDHQILIVKMCKPIDIRNLQNIIFILEP